MHERLTSLVVAIAGGKECLAIRTFRSANPGPEATLVVFIHGDLNDGGTADYIYERAREAVADGRIVVGLVRPGYAGRRDSRAVVSHGCRPPPAAPSVCAVLQLAAPAFVAGFSTAG